jgi:hypothetical protein
MSLLLLLATVADCGGATTVTLLLLRLPLLLLAVRLDMWEVPLKDVIAERSKKKGDRAT